MIIDVNAKICAFISWRSQLTLFGFHLKIVLVIWRKNFSQPTCVYFFLAACKTRHPLTFCQKTFSKVTTWVPDWPMCMTSDLSELSNPTTWAVCVSQCSPDVWTDYLFLKTVETWWGRSPKSEQNKESDFTDLLSIKHLRGTITLTILTGILVTSKEMVQVFFFPI